MDWENLTTADFRAMTEHEWDQLLERTLREATTPRKIIRVNVRIRTPQKTATIYPLAEIDPTEKRGPGRPSKMRIGVVFGNRTVIEIMGKRNGAVIVKLRCLCGREDQIAAANAARSTQCSDCAKHARAATMREKYRHRTAEGNQ